MKEILIEIGTSVACLFLAAILACAARWFHTKCEQLKTKTDNEAMKNLIEKVDYIVQTCVEATNQTFVDDKKKEGSLSDTDKQEAFNMTFESIENMLTDDDREKIVESFGDLGTFLRNSVENYIRNSKIDNIDIPI